MKSDLINNWHRIWSNRTPQKSLEENVLQQLISADGFDTPLGVMAENDWKDYVELFTNRSGIAQDDSIFEIGCGGGAFLYPFYEAGFEVGGIDYSQELIQIAQTAMPQRKNFLHAMEASSCPIFPAVNVVIANHVIHYFPSLDYSTAVLDLMLQKALRVVSISGIPNANLKEESESTRRGLLSLEEYESKYRGLDILYYQQNWFIELATKHGFVARFFDHEMPGFAQARFRYDCVLTKFHEDWSCLPDGQIHRTRTP